jgi:hypothetical protein
VCCAGLEKFLHVSKEEVSCHGMVNFSVNLGCSLLKGGEALLLEIGVSMEPRAGALYYVYMYGMTEAMTI